MQELIRKTLKSYKIILASNSPRRKELIGRIKNLQVEIVPSEADENADKTCAVEEKVMNLAYTKALDVFKKRGGIVLGADTLVSAGRQILGKPENKKDALKMFEMLCGKTHQVTTGICFISETKIIKKFEKTYVTFGAFNEELVYNYINTGKPFDKAGGYGIQDEELKPLIAAIDGELSNVIGLPLALTEKTLKENF